MVPARYGWLAAALLAAAAAGWTLVPGSSDGSRRESLGLFTTLPIFWPETASVSEALSGSATTPWQRVAIERRYELKPLSLLAGREGQSHIAPFAALLLAQPRALSASENVALDAWVKQGGRLLLFADPLLTAQSRFAPGDPRRPQDVALLSPILRHWGLELQFDDAQPPGERTTELLGLRLPIDLPGSFRLTAPDEADVHCRVIGEGIAASCAIGKGRVLAIADAALLDPAGHTPEVRGETLLRLMRAAYEQE